MSHAESTSNYGLPIFADNDQPTWLGDFNGAMNKIDTSLSTVDTTSRANAGDIASLKLSNADNKAAIAKLHDGVDTLERELNNIDVATSTRAGLVKLTDTYNPTQTVISNTAVTSAAVREALSPLVASSMLCIGDSFLDGYTKEGNVTPWGTLLGAKLGCSVTNVSKGGAGFGATIGGANFATMVNNAADNAYDVVVFGGSVNDRTLAKNVVVSGLKTALENAHNRWPDAKIYVFGFLWGCKGYGASVEDISAAMQRATAEQSAAKVFYCKGCWTWNIGKTGNVSADGIHPNAIGQQVIANSMYQFMEGGDPTVYTEDVAVTGSGIKCKRIYDTLLVIANGVSGKDKIGSLDPNYSAEFCGTSGIATRSNTYVAGLFTIADQTISVFGNSIDANGYFSVSTPLKMSL